MLSSKSSRHYLPLVFHVALSSGFVTHPAKSMLYWAVIWQHTLHGPRVSLLCRIHSLEGMLTQASLSASSQAAPAVATHAGLASHDAPTSVQSSPPAATAGVQPTAVLSTVASPPPPAATATSMSPHFSAAHSQQTADAAASSSANSQYEAAAEQPASGDDSDGAEVVQTKLHQQQPVGTESEAPSSDAAAESKQDDIRSLAVTGSFSA